MSQPANDGPVRIVSSRSRPPLRFLGWPWWRWLVLVVAAGATFAYESYALFWLAFGVSGEHPAPVDAKNVEAGTRGLTLVLLAPWAAASIFVHRRLRVIVAGLLCTIPAMWFWWEVAHMQ